MSLWIVWSPSERRVIVNARSVDEAISVGNSFVGGPAQARGATQADIESFPLLGPSIRGDTRPALEADPQFVASFGFTIPGAAERDPRLPPLPTDATPPTGGSTKGLRAPPADGGLPKPGDPDFIGPLPNGGSPSSLTPEQVDKILKGLDRGMATGPGTPGFIPAPRRPVPGDTDFIGPLPPEDRGPLGLTGGDAPLPDSLSPRDLVNTLFRRGLGARIGAGPGDLESSILGRAALGKQSQFENVFGFQRGLAGFQTPSNVGGVRTDQNQAFEDFVKNTSGINLGEEAARAFRTLSGQEAGAVPSATAAFREQFGGANEDQSNQLAQLVRSALSAGVSPLALNLLRLPSGEDLRSRFIAETGGGPEANFIEFVWRNFPLASTIR